MRSVLVVDDMHVGDSGENNTVWFDLEWVVSVGEFHRCKFLHSPRLLAERKPAAHSMSFRDESLPSWGSKPKGKRIANVSLARVEHVCGCDCCNAYNSTVSHLPEGCHRCKLASSPLLICGGNLSYEQPPSGHEWKSHRSLRSHEQASAQSDRQRPLGQEERSALMWQEMESRTKDGKNCLQ